MKRTLSILLIAISIFAIGFFCGRNHTILNASLHDIDKSTNTYTIDFNGSIHTYGGTHE